MLSLSLLVEFGEWIILFVVGESEPTVNAPVFSDNIFRFPTPYVLVLFCT
jgi:hypothetical protein